MLQHPLVGWNGQQVEDLAGRRRNEGLRGNSGAAKHVELVLESQDGGYLMEIGDDGDTMHAHTARTTLGMRQRMQGIGGNLDIEIAPGQGTRVRAFAPQSPAGSG